MAKYRIYDATYINGIHLGAGASIAYPREIELPDSTPPALKWDPLDEAALKALENATIVKARARCFDLDPVKDKDKIAKVFEDTKKQYRKTIIRPPEPKVEPRDLDTNVGMMEQGRKVVGRPSDKSPV
jgi:hypothetical protein